MSAVSARADPFGLGMRACDTGVARARCPFPEHYVEGRQWLTGWDYRHARARGTAPAHTRIAS